MIYQPIVGSFLTVMLPGEKMRCEVVDLVDGDRVLVEISGQPMTRTHHYRKGDRTGARRRIEFGREVWEALDDRDFLANRSPAEPVRPKEEPKPKVAPKRKKAEAKRKGPLRKKAHG
jgi:hypothetical protein